MNREQIVRDTAYAIWEAEGKPDGRADDHWQQAEDRVAASLKEAGSAKAATAKPVAKAKDAKTASAKATPAKATRVTVAKKPAPRTKPGPKKG